ncbi:MULTISPECIES: Hpt domain-containing protein [unclassified Chelatococcus]|uniref:Hpt domain-containing protein n=1 Tax=unclassified Chelatococcus TaxID=2638111 RepID=UPI001BD0DD1C|nr:MULTISPECIES: Hpt domain-containing protein [unclassified Chelatococcus]MBS7698023.1 Hpt domain-containing protein [Chelatococcus sp. YT9]MBX3556659.1 Hpt domain-containing protein [Chelatococcus sp.]
MSERFGEASPAKDAVDIDAAYLDQQTGGDSELACEIIGLFRDQLRQQHAVITGEGDLRARSDAAHTLKGSSRAIGAWKLAAIVQDIEDALADPATPELKILFRRFDAAITAADTAMQDILARAI